ncbi:MAG: glycosyl hydrolase family 28 protein [Bacteroidales bacterium]|jgi:polygalacturonase
MTLMIFLTIHASAIIVDVVSMGAKGDGKTVNTVAIQKAIDKCHKAGGGKVLFANGHFVTGTIYLKDNVSLLIERGARILGSKNINDYPSNSLNFRFRHEDWIKQALVFAYKCKNIGIEGDGTIDGQGEFFQIDRKSEPKPHPWKNRPFIIWFSECQNVSVTGVELRNSAMWMQLYLGCDYLKIDGIRVFNHVNENNDMMDITGCSNVVVNNVIGSSDDDGITLKGFSNHISENITITNCVLSSHCNGIKIGTETNSPFRNITISNCVIKKSIFSKPILGRAEGITGISLESVDGSVVDGVTINNIIIDGAQVPIFIRLGQRGYKTCANCPDTPAPGVGAMRNIIISNIIARAGAMFGNCISGIPGANIEKVTLNNIRFICKGNGTVKHAEAIVPEKINSYPEGWMFGILPSYGLYLRHVNNIYMSDIIFDLENSDARPAMVFDDVTSARVNGVYLEGVPSKLYTEIGCSDIKVVGNN